jgi:hypothetical protein
MEPVFGTVTLQIVCISQKHLKIIYITCEGVQIVVGRWFRENRAEFYTILALAELCEKLRGKVRYRKQYKSRGKFCVWLHFENSSGCKDKNMEALHHNNVTFC